MLEAGQKFPDFHLPNQDNDIRSLASYRGKWLVLYIYPKDDTPGCTVQAKAFTETKQEYEKAGAVVVGISADSVDSHKQFCDKYKLAVDLLADSKAELLDRTGVGQKTFRGGLYWNRTTFIIDPQGTIRKVYTGVEPNGHEGLILTDLKELQK